MAEIGYGALLTAFGAAIYAAIAFILGMRRGRPALIESAQNSLLAVFGLVSISVATLVLALLVHDYQIEYVAAYSSNNLPLVYLITALWAGNDGSLLFWAWLISLVATVMVLRKRVSGKELVPYASVVIMGVETFFLTLLLFVQNPFHKLSFVAVPAEGVGLNPLLENIWMVFHPPLLLAGYVSLTVPFAFAIAALLTRRLGDEWLIIIRRWTLLAWLFLSVGNLLGAWWAYVELGWGGYWAWDPVENAGLMPWLIVTAFLHSIMMQRRRGMLKVWNIVLIILAFSLTIFGTFVTRSGVLISVHSFGQSALGPFFLTFFFIIFFGSLALLLYRRNELKGEAEMESLVSRESTFLLNNLLLICATLAIFVGTIFPMISEAVRGGIITVGQSFFNQVVGPIFLAIILLAGVCTLIGWRRASIKNLLRNFLWPLLTALILGVALFFSGIRQWYALVAFFLCGFVLFTILYDWLRGTRARHQTRGENYLRAFGALIWANKPRYGGYIVHISIILIAIGVVGSSFYGNEEEAALMPGESMTINDYTLTYDGLAYYPTTDKMMFTATLSVSNSEKLIGQVTPDIYYHRSFEQSVTEVAIRATLLEDLYVILVGWDQDGTTAFKVMVNPLVSWIWIGGGVLILGGLIAFWPERRKPVTTQAKKGRG